MPCKQRGLGKPDYHKRKIHHAASLCLPPLKIWLIKKAKQEGHHENIGYQAAANNNRKKRIMEISSKTIADIMAPNSQKQVV